MALPTLPATSLSLNGKDVTTEYGLYVSKVTGAEPLTKATVGARSLADIGTQSVGNPLPKARLIRITGTIGSSTSATDLNQNIAKLAADLGRTTYGYRTIHLAFTQPLLEFEGVYGGEFTVTPVGKAGVALWAEISFTVSVRLVEAETQPTEIASGTLDSTDETIVFLEPTASKGASWKALAVFDEAVIAIKNSNATQVTAVDIKGLFQKRYKSVAAVSSGVIKYDVGQKAHTGSVKFASGDTHTVKYAINDGVFFPTSGELLIFMRIKPRFVIATDATDRVLFSCSNSTDSDRTKILFTTSKTISYRIGGFQQAVDYTSGPAIEIDKWATVMLRIGIGLSFTSLNLYDDAGNPGASISFTALTPKHPGTHFHIGSNTDGSSPCKCDIGEISILSNSTISELIPATDPSLFENNRLRMTEWLSFGADFRASLGLDGVSRGFRELNGLDAGGLIQQNEEIFIDLKRRKVFRVDHDDMDSGRGGDISEQFFGEWPSIGNLSTVEISTTPKQATMTYRINGKVAAIE